MKSPKKDKSIQTKNRLVAAWSWEQRLIVTGVMKTFYTRLQSIYVQLGKFTKNYCIIHFTFYFIWLFRVFTFQLQLAFSIVY